MTDKIKEQIIKVQESGETNMFDLPAVQQIAHQLDLYELVIYLAEGNIKEYSHFIFTGIT